jgi:hypothetical protein
LIKCDIETPPQELGVIGVEKEENVRDRLTEFTANVVRLVEDFPKSRSGNHLADRVLNTATEPAARWARNENRTDDIEDDVVEMLNETLFYLQLAHRVDLLRHKNFLKDVIQEGEELVDLVQK